MRLAGEGGLAKRVVGDTRRWLERAVIGLNLCPFAKAVSVRGQIHFVVSDARNSHELLNDLRQEMDDLLACSEKDRDTSLLVAACCMGNFQEFNVLLGRADQLLRKQGLEGILQIASFHPDYQFADAAADALGNFTNRAPYPTLHLLRESSVDHAVAAFPDASLIVDRNLETLQRLGEEGWRALDVGRSPPPAMVGGSNG